MSVVKNLLIERTSFTESVLTFCHRKLTVR